MTAASLRLPVPAPGVLHDSAQRLFDAIVAAEATDLSTAGSRATPSEAALQAIAVAWPHAQVVSFDIFDTLVVRKVASPRDVFLHLATLAPFAGWGLSSVDLALHRHEAEHTARRQGMATRQSGEVTLHEIHAALADRLQRPATDVAAMVAAERLVERAVCVAHPYLRTQFERAVREGKTVWCVSDTYHEASFLGELLESCGYALDGVMVVSSADRRMCKGEGRLLRQLATDAALDPSRVLHIGDHRLSDFTIPAQQGFLAVLHPWAASRHDDPPSQHAGDSIALGLAQIGARAVQPAFPFWWRFGYSVAGPLLSAFAIWLHGRFVAEGIDRAYFLLRDGEIMLDVYRAVIGDRALAEVALLESSRRAFVLPAMESARGSITAQLMACENPMAARGFLERFGVQVAPLAAEFRAAGFTSVDDIVSPRDGLAVQRLHALFARPAVLTALVQCARAERALLWRYLQQERVTSPGRIALVDIGWNGTIQKSLMAIGALQGCALDVHGFYLGTQPAIAPDLGGSRSTGFYFDAGQPVARARAMLDLQQLVEFICTSDRGSLHGFRMSGARVEPVHGAVEHPDAQREAHAQLRSGAIAFARGLAAEQTVFGAHAVSADAGLRHFARAVQHPTPEEAEHIGNIRHGDGLGSDRLRSLARFGDGPVTIESLMADYARAYWRTGLLARREPAALALRTVLWMRDA
jgi:FMN phosphatase YigB (HAD superfamily)